MKFWFSQSEAFLINPSFLDLTTAYRSIFDIKLHDEHLFRQFYGSILSPKRRKVPRSVTSTTIYPNRKDQMPARFHLLNTVVNTFDLSKSSVVEKKSSFNLLESWISSIQISESLRQKSKFILPVKWFTVILKNAQNIYLIVSHTLSLHFKPLWMGMPGHARVWWDINTAPHLSWSRSPRMKSFVRPNPLSVLREVVFVLWPRL